MRQAYRRSSNPFVPDRYPTIRHPVQNPAGCEELSFCLQSGRVDAHRSSRYSPLISDAHTFNHCVRVPRVDVDLVDVIDRDR